MLGVKWHLKTFVILTRKPYARRNSVQNSTLSENSSIWKQNLNSSGNIVSCCWYLLSQCLKVPQIFVSLPIFVATAERNFSSLRCLKTWLRATVGKIGRAGITWYTEKKINLGNVGDNSLKERREIWFYFISQFIIIYFVRKIGFYFNMFY
jgi:hypothetical protein